MGAFFSSAQSSVLSAQSDAPRAGTNAAVTRGPGGFSVSLGQGREWQHPWQTSMWWLGDRKEWVATVRPGFVNGKAPIVRTRAALARSLAGRFYNGLVTARSGAADIARAAELARESGDVPEAGTLDVRLTNNPPIQLPFRALGFDSGGGNGTGVPSFFQRLGVSASSTPVTDGFTNAEAVVASFEQTQPKGNRLLRAADVVLHQPRLALTSTITYGAGPVTGISNASQTLGLRSAAPGDRLKVFATPLWTPPDAAGINPLLGDYEEPTWDELRIATVYLVSPPDTLPGSEPDGRWVPYVQHSLFWNLTYLARTALEVPQLDNALGALGSLGQALAGGVASFAVNYYAAAANDLTQNALNMLAAHSMAGSWWTTTGGGSTSEFPAEVPVASKQANGWNKAARLQAKRIAAARALKAARLDPPFPFRAVSFPISLLNT
jgi:hypothetical protein